MAGENALLKTRRVDWQQLRRRIDPGEFDFETTAAVEPLRGTIGQERALEAVEVGLEIVSPGFNIFACGEVGTGRNSTLMALTKQRAGKRPTPSDWCYVYNFEQPDRPLAVKLPAGKGRELAADMEDLLHECTREIPKAFEGEDYEKRRNETMQQVHEERDTLLASLQERATKLDHAVRITRSGIVALPVVDEKPLSGAEFEKLDETTKEDLHRKGTQVQELVTQTLAQVRQLEKDAREKARQLDRRVALFAVGHLVEMLTEKYREYERVTEYLKHVQHDIIDHLDLFRGGEEPQAQMLGMRIPMKQAYDRYRVNVVVDNSATKGAPIIDERNPTYYNLFGQLEYQAQFGGMITDFTMIKAGAYQKANGGYLVLQALDVLRNPLAWEALKRTIRTGKACIENMWEQFRPIPAATLQPETIPVKVKVILVGSRWLYQLLYMFDEDFCRLFKIKADFDVEMDLNRDHLSRYAAFVSARCAEAGLPPFDREAVARVAEQGVRLAEHQERLSTRFLKINNVIAEAGHRATDEKSATVTARHVRDAISAMKRRSRMMQDKVQRLIEEGTLLLDITGAVAGQVNGLAVYDLGDYQFGKPSRITCVTSVGRAGVMNIERESKMSGSIHDKGVLILSGYLASRFGMKKPLSLSASLTFEQSYGMVEGDSASCAELYALVSSLAGVALRQDIAVTGSVNQRGQVQPVGGVNWKIEGFYDVCKVKGLTGKQGALIPRTNLHDLMLDEEVVEAVREGKFHVWAVDSVEEGIEILTGTPAGQPDEKGEYPAESVYGKVDGRLNEMAQVLKDWGGPATTPVKVVGESAPSPGPTPPTPPIPPAAG